jgi:hypothetical protein
MHFNNIDCRNTHFEPATKEMLFKRLEDPCLENFHSIIKEFITTQYDSKFNQGTDKDAIDFLYSVKEIVKEIEYIKYDQYNFDIVNRYEKAANNAIKYLQSEGILTIQTGSAIKREARTVALKIIDTCIRTGNYEFIAVDPTQKDDDEDDDISEKAEIVKVSSTIMSPKERKYSYIIDDRVFKAVCPFAYEIFEKMMKSYYLTNTIYADELKDFIDAMKGYINDISIHKLDSEIKYIHFLPSKDNVILQFYCDEINDYISIIINLFITTNPYKE